VTLSFVWPCDDLDLLMSEYPVIHLYTRFELSTTNL